MLVKQIIFPPLLDMYNSCGNQEIKCIFMLENHILMLRMKLQQNYRELVLKNRTDIGRTRQI
jgi:hypothetical protein